MAAGTPGSLIGVLPEPDLHDEEFVLQPGDRLVLYTDGVTEGRGIDGFFGDERLEVAVTGAGPPARATVDALLREVLAFQDDNPRDDIAIVAIAVP